MSSKKWLVLFVCTVLIVGCAVAVFNYLTDPFGVFGDPILEWYSYDMTNNPRTAKISYLDKYHENYDSYIIGCSSTSSFPVDAFNEYLGASFYNAVVYGADMLDSEQMINYIIDNYGAKNIILNVYIDNASVYDEESNKYTHCMPYKLDGSSAALYYARFLFANVEYGAAKLKNMREQGFLPETYSVFDEKSGAYDKRRRDVEPISDLADYIEDYPVFADYPGGEHLMPHIDDTLASVRRIKEKCDENGVRLIVVTAPVYADYFALFREEDVKAFYGGLAEITDYWDFSYSSVSFEPRYFYDGTHFRNNVGYMAAARMFGDESVWMPDDFGRLVTAENAGEYFTAYTTAVPMAADDCTSSVPVLMYHHIAEETNGNTMVITPEAFESHIAALANEGYTAVTLEELYEYVTTDADLPEKSVVITFDDGYASNYEYAYPILERYDMTATIFVIGSSIGKSTYKDTDRAIIPHFGEDEIEEMLLSGVISIGSHTYDMHRSVEIEGEGTRDKMLRLSGEDEDAYITSIRDDVAAMRALIGGGADYLAYPQGYSNDVAAAVLREEGVRVTLSTEYGVAEVVKGAVQSLYSMKRIDASTLSAEELLDAIGDR